jgi:hypothetical protein
MIFAFYSIITITISFDSQDELGVSTTIAKGANTKNLENRKFFLENGKISKTMQNYINGFFSQYHYIYVSVMLHAKYQIAIPKCDKKILKQLKIPTGEVSSLCVGDKYMICAYKEEIAGIQKMFQSVGVDFIISPIIVFDYVCSSLSKKGDDIVLYALLQKTYMIIVIYKNKQMLFNRYNHVEVKKTSIKDEPEEDVLPLMGDDFDSIEIDDSLEDDLDSDHEELSLIDDNIDEFDSFDSADDFENDKMVLTEFIQSSIGDFYENDVYVDSDFVNEIVIMSEDRKLEEACSFIEGNLFMNVSYKPIKILDATSKISVKEIKNEL